MPDNKAHDEFQASLDYHEFPKPGKLEIRATKPMATGRDLSRAYSPGVANACLEIEKDPALARRYTAKGNLVAVISNGTAVLGLGNIGAQASKPVMEGKAVLFKKFAGIDCFDIEVDETDPEKLADLVCKLEPTFGAINLEDIKAPDCFLVERICRERMNIPVFHDDQHGTAIVAAAAAFNALHVAGKTFEAIKIVALGAGAAGIACLKMLIVMGAKRENITMLDSKGVVHTRRNDLSPEKAEFARETEMRTTMDAMEGADLFLGVSGPGLLTAEMVGKMAEAPIIFALANPTPEIMPEEARKASPQALIATGRSDYPNQVNNVLCFPFIFRGALDVGATTINEAMKIACVEAIASLARQTASAELGTAYQGEKLTFGPDYLIPKPFDPRLLPTVAVAVAKAAIESGVATRELDLEAYAKNLQTQVYRSALIMRPVFEAARRDARRIVFAEGEEPRILRTAQAMTEESFDKPILIGRPQVIEQRIEREGLSIVPRPRLRGRQPGERRALPRLLDGLFRTHETPRRFAGSGQIDDPHQHDGDRRYDGAARRGRQPDLRHGRPVSVASRLCPPDPVERRASSGRSPVAGADGQGSAVHRRHPCPHRAGRRRSRRHVDRGGAPRAPLRHRAEDRALLGFAVRQSRQCLGPRRA